MPAASRSMMALKIRRAVILMNLAAQLSLTLIRAEASHSKLFFQQFEVAVQKNHRAQRRAITSGIGVAEIPEADSIGSRTVVRAVFLSFRHGVLCPVEIDTTEICLLGCQCDRSLFRLVADLHTSFGIGFRG